MTVHKINRERINTSLEMKKKCRYCKKTNHLQAFCANKNVKKKSMFTIASRG